MLGLDFFVVDCGVKGGPFAPHDKLLSSRMGEGTADFSQEAAMSRDTAIRALESGAQMARQMATGGANTLCFGEMGIGNTTSAAALMAAFTGLAPQDCAGRGTGLDDIGVTRKAAVIARALRKAGPLNDPLDILARFGGFELAHMAGAMIGAAHANCAVIVDGFVSGAAFLAAEKLRPHLRDCTFFAHCSAERGHRKLLDSIGATPLLDLSMRLGEGTGAALAIPLLRAACASLTDMASFESAGVSQSKVEAASSRLTSTTSGKMPLPLSQDAPRYFEPFDEIKTRQANLPHWEQAGVLYFVTFRLADSLPRKKTRGH
ncbi:nicotinate-nucleotide--dimethylbenzimidazole phosphoribosyltransferase [Oscillatoria amoena NRMC-F 0135]|nr:nicotinate-nucleotide--dimethylbenzimidazole phosphoribosyltransferase [Oscillatoria amoena NRMC-F 0135]